MTNIIILHTGGTIASKVDYSTGGVSNLTEPDELLAQYPELQDVATVKARFIANMSSDDMRFAHWNLLAKAVEESVKDYDGIIITHGTDTMHYTAAALHYALLGVPVPVVLVGSQRSSDRGSSDAATNLLGAARFITGGGPAGVYLAMHEGPGDEHIGIFHGVNSRKMHSSRRDAFKAINRHLAARVTPDDMEVLYEPSNRTFEPTRFKEDLRVGMLYAHPNMSPSELSCFADFDALVVLGTGLGHLPINDYDDATAVHKEIREMLAALAQNMPVVMGTQTIHGRVNMQVYSAGRRHMELGVLGHDLAFTPETLFVKTAWLLSQGLDVSEHLSHDHDDAIERTPEEAYE